MLARASFAQGIHCLTVFTDINTVDKILHHGELIGIKQKLGIIGNQTTFHPARSMQNEIHPAHNRWNDRMRRFISGLRIGCL